MKHGCTFEDRNGPVAAAGMAMTAANNAAIWVRFMTPFYGAAERRSS
jgi:lipocalin